jgi:uncharacterized protein
MRYSTVSRCWSLVLQGGALAGSSAIYDFPLIYSAKQLWVLGGFSIILLLNPLHAAGVVFDATDPPAIQWQDWGPEVFRRAQAEDKLIVLDLTAVWCHACHVMDQTTYASPRIIQLVNADFIPVRVDTDQRPDLEARYRAGGWPTTNLLLPTGEILLQANALEPEEMEDMLLEVQSIYVKDKASLFQQAFQLWDQVVREKGERRVSQESALQVSMVEQSVAMMRRQFDPVNGGFRDAPKFFEPDAIQMAITQGFFENDPALIKMAVYTLEKQVSLLDPVWGGFYRYAERANWSQPHFEKMLTIQARNLRNYVEAYQLTGNLLFKDIALAVIEYVSRFLTDPQTGMFYESQDADVLGEEGGIGVSGAEYYDLNESQRLALGFPHVDQRIFTGSNALMAGAYLHASPILEQPEIQDRALQTLSQLFASRFDTERGLAHVEKEGVSPLYGLLSDHILYGHALLEAFNSTGQFSLLQRAEVLAEVTRQLLQDPVNRGFFDRPQMSDTLGLLKLPAKPMVENFQAAIWFLKLFHLTGNQEYRSTAEGTLQAMVTSPQPLPIALAGLAIDQWFRGPVHIAVVGIPDNPMTEALLLEGRRVFCPGKIVRGFDPREGPPTWGEIVFSYNDRPVAYVCTDRMCSAPIFQKELMNESITEMVAVLKERVHQ